ncbi:hypothetical protein AX17_002837 [Amanita inopinata Kibby_2008]|nr:hypothetical protein AX17_002837 [Amanita inopinata Kibby_2008]
MHDNYSADYYNDYQQKLDYYDDLDLSTYADCFDDAGQDYLDEYGEGLQETATLCSSPTQKNQSMTNNNSASVRTNDNRINDQSYGSAVQSRCPSFEFESLSSTMPLYAAGENRVTTQDMNNGQAVRWYQRSSFERYFPEDDSRRSGGVDSYNWQRIAKEKQPVSQLRPVSELPDIYRNIFKFGVFNAVQSSCFDTVYYSDQNTVISGKTR